MVRGSSPKQGMMEEVWRVPLAMRGARRLNYSELSGFECGVLEAI